MKIIITMAGEGSRFRKVGYKIPKHEIKVDGKSLFELSVGSLKNFFGEEFIFVIRKEHNIDFIEKRIKEMGIDRYSFFIIDKLTSGQAETVNLVVKEKKISDSILIFNIDTAINYKVISPSDISGDFWWLTADMEGDHWSFAKMSKTSYLVKTSEKIRISSYASLGMYFFKSASQFNEIFEKNRESVIKECSETYIAPFYNYIDKSKFSIKHISKKYVFGLGTPGELSQSKERISELNYSPDITLVVSVFNNQQGVDNIVKRYKENKKTLCVDSQLVIVDNGSTKLIEVIEEDDIFLIRKDYGNIGFGRQVALDNAIGKYITISDSDDDFDDDYLSFLYNEALSSKADLVNANKVNKNFETNKIMSIQRMSKNGKMLSLKAYPHNRLFKRNLVKGIDISKETTFDDLSFVPIIIGSANIISEVDSNYYWRVDVENSAVRGSSIARNSLLIEKAIQPLLASKNLKYVKDTLSWEMIWLEINTKGILKKYKFKPNFLNWRIGENISVNIFIIMYKLRVLWIIRSLYKYINRRKI